VNQEGVCRFVGYLVSSVGTSRIGDSGVCGFVASVLGHPRDLMSSVGSWRDLVDLACAAGRGFFVPAKATPFPIRASSCSSSPRASASPRAGTSPSSAGTSTPTGRAARYGSWPRSPWSGLSAIAIKILSNGYLPLWAGVVITALDW
jgi:hypothetical protein